MKYLIVEATSAGALQQQVQQYIDKGGSQPAGCPLPLMAQERGGTTKQ